jgi:hypothetical protein
MVMLHQPSRQSVVATNDELRVLSREVDGFPKITVRGPVHGRDRVLYQKWEEGLGITYALPWTIISQGKTIEGFLIAYEYGTGSSNQITIVGPDKSGKWKELLHTDAAIAARYPPQFVDLIGDGILDVLVVSDFGSPDVRGGKIGLADAKVEDWRWSPQTGRYFLAAKSSYGHRLDVKGDRSQRPHHKVHP